MSKLRKLLAEWKQMEDGNYVDTETGEISDVKPSEESGVKWKDEKPSAQSKYLNEKYLNKWDKVSPFNIIMVDMIGQLYSVDPNTAADIVVDTVNSLNREFGSTDKTYDYVSQEYLKKVEMNIRKKKSIDKVIEYLTNIYFKGIGMTAELDFKMVKKAIYGINALEKINK